MATTSSLEFADASDLSDVSFNSSSPALSDGILYDGYDSSEDSGADHVVDRVEEPGSSTVLDQEHIQYGCVHYRRKCRIRASCCNEIFDCRHCHNDAKNSFEIDPQERHDLPRHEVEKVICAVCNTEQEVQQTCKNCGVQMGEYFCEKCKFWDDDTSKQQYHCEGCGICRTGGRDNFFHCYRCGCCYSVLLQDRHPCVERAMHHNCPVCFEFLFESTKAISVMPCGHTIHEECLKEMWQHFQFSCPMCSKSVYNMSKVWENLDHEIALTPMPEAYQNKMVWILCNDCGTNSEVRFHVVGRKCLNCSSYNTRQIREGTSSQSCASQVV